MAHWLVILRMLGPLSVDVTNSHFGVMLTSQMPNISSKICHSSTNLSHWEFTMNHSYQPLSININRSITIHFCLAHSISAFSKLSLASTRWNRLENHEPTASFHWNLRARASCHAICQGLLQSCWDLCSWRLRAHNLHQQNSACLLIWLFNSLLRKKILWHKSMKKTYI